MCIVWGITWLLVRDQVLSQNLVCQHNSKKKGQRLKVLLKVKKLFKYKGTLPKNEIFFGYLLELF